MNLFATLAILLAVCAQQGYATWPDWGSGWGSSGGGGSSSSNCKTTTSCRNGRCTTTKTCGGSTGSGNGLPTGNGWNTGNGNGWNTGNGNGWNTGDGNTGSSGNQGGGSSGNQGGGSTDKGCKDKFSNCNDFVKGIGGTCDDFYYDCTCACSGQKPKEKTCKRNQNLGALTGNCGSSRNVKRCQMTQSDITAVLKAHNVLRRKVASGNEPGLPAGTIGDLTWDADLAREAQDWLNNCKFGHNKPHTSTFGDKIGQNAATFSKSKDPGGMNSDILVKAVNNWYGEVQDYVAFKCTPRSFDYYKKCIAGRTSTYGKKGKVQIGHFTQVIWAATTKVGCGWIQYKNGGWYKTLVTCNYGKQGNMGGQPVYT